VLALAVVDAMWTQLDSTVADRVLAAKGRVGVYLGVWQASALGPSASAYGVLGSASTAVLAARVANTYDFQGPALTVNTACSSSLVAVDLALADLRRGRIDYAIVGGVNLLDRSGLVSQHLRKGNFLSPTSRCHTFSAKADGYVRGEGGACFLLGRDDGVSPCHALVVGASVNQNSRREPITSVDPQAQTNLLRAACADAGLEPRDLAAVEMHGTGTRIGDPVEVSALAQLLGSSSTSKHCYLTAAKMHMGHLESAAGALGLLKAVLMVQERAVPRFTVPEPNPLVTQAMLGTCLRLPTSAPARLASEALVGVSSFGFAGNNAHAIVRGVPEARAMPRAATPAGCACCTRPLALDAPAQAMPVATPVLHAPVAVATPKELKLADAAGMPVKALVLAALAEVGVDVSEELDPSTSVLDLGLDSLAMAELSSLLHIDMDDLFEDPSVASVLALVAATGRAATTAAAPAADLISSTGARSKATNEEATKSTGSPASLKSRVLAALAEVGAEVEEDVDMTTSVLDLGLDSLGMAELASLLHIDMDLIFEDPSIANVIDVRPSSLPPPPLLSIVTVMADGHLDLLHAPTHFHSLRHTLATLIHTHAQTHSWLSKRPCPSPWLHLLPPSPLHPAAPSPERWCPPLPLPLPLPAPAPLCLRPHRAGSAGSAPHTWAPCPGLPGGQSTRAWVSGRSCAGSGRAASTSSTTGSGNTHTDTHTHTHTQHRHL
jgi:3-oxoacyl-(acyl-carrier-protein) synthase/acyl carrier protein